MDDSFWRQVNRARKMSPDERFREGLGLCDRARRLMEAGVRHQFPKATMAEVSQILRQRMSVIRGIETKR
jgi:hypothetical protein